MADIIVVSIIIIVVALAVRYLVRAKNNGQSCIGCPSSGICNKSRNCKCDRKSENN